MNRWSQVSCLRPGPGNTWFSSHGPAPSQATGDRLSFIPFVSHPVPIPLGYKHAFHSPSLVYAIVSRIQLTLLVVDEQNPFPFCVCDLEKNQGRLL